MIVVPVQEVQYVATNGHHLSIYPWFKHSSSSYLSPNASRISDSGDFHSLGRTNPTNMGTARSPVQPCTSPLCFIPPVCKVKEEDLILCHWERRIPHHEQANSEPLPCISISNRETGIWPFSCQHPSCRKVLGKPRTEYKILKVLLGEPKPFCLT